jgi:hypothetical protein
MSSVESAHPEPGAAVQGGYEPGGVASATARLSARRGRHAEAARVAGVRAALNLQPGAPLLGARSGAETNAILEGSSSGETSPWPSDA